ncbi:MAG: hypothetical protein ACK5AZ_22580 [Bryobacteraceae bacterium]
MEAILEELDRTDQEWAASGDEDLETLERLVRRRFELIRDLAAEAAEPGPIRQEWLERLWKVYDATTRMQHRLLTLRSIILHQLGELNQHRHLLHAHAAGSQGSGDHFVDYSG